MGWENGKRNEDRKRKGRSAWEEQDLERGKGEADASREGSGGRG